MKYTIEPRLNERGATVVDFFDKEGTLVGTSYREFFTEYIQEHRIEDFVELQKKHDELSHALEKLIEHMECDCTADGAVVCPECNARRVLEKSIEERY